MYKNTKCKLQAHRGVSTDAPENTMAAFRLAVEQGYDIIEFDPKCTKDSSVNMIEAHRGLIGNKATYMDYGYFGVLSSDFDDDGFPVGT